jgi:hypothetical protein
MVFSPKIPIFVSSTYTDLIPYRNVAREILSQFHADIRGMEVFGARTQKPLDTCLEEVSTSEVFIGIIGMRYGSVDKESGKSFVELEYETAKQNHLEILIYIIDEENASIPPINVDCQNAEKLKDFKKRLKIHTCCFFNSVNDLSLKIKGDMEKYFAKRVGEPSRSKAFVSGTVSSSTIAKGDDFFIAGTATETQFLGVAIWVFGQNNFYHWVVDVRDDDSYILTIPSVATKAMPSGQYFVVIQHPMQNHTYDVIPVISQNSIIVKNSFNKEKFVVSGPNSLSSMEAAKNLVEFINKSTIDDTYTKMQFLIEDPVIRINSLQPKKSGAKFTISGVTNLAVGNEILIQVMPKMVPQGAESYLGIRGITKIVKGESGLNSFSFDIELVNTKPGEYLISVISYKIELVWNQVFTVV